MLYSVGDRRVPAVPHSFKAVTRGVALGERPQVPHAYSDTHDGSGTHTRASPPVAAMAVSRRCSAGSSGRCARTGCLVPTEHIDLAMLRVSGRTSHGSRDQGTSARALGRTGTRGSPLLWPGRAMPSQHYAAGNERTPSTDSLISTAGSTPLLHAAASLLLRPCSGRSSELHGREQTLPPLQLQCCLASVGQGRAFGTT